MCIFKRNGNKKGDMELKNFFCCFYTEVGAVSVIQSRQKSWRCKSFERQEGMGPRAHSGLRGLRDSHLK